MFYLRVKASGSGELTGRSQSNADPPQGPLMSLKSWKVENKSENKYINYKWIYLKLAAWRVWTHRHTRRSQTFHTLWSYQQGDDIGPAPTLHKASYAVNPVETQTVQMWWPEGKEQNIWNHTNQISIYVMNIYSKCVYLHPEPFSHNFYPPVWIQLITHETQVARPVCDPGDH